MTTLNWKGRLCWAIAAVAVGQSPGGLVSSRSEALGPLIAGTPIATQRPALPADAARLMVLTCVYPGQDVRHYWLGTAPPWQAAIPAGHPLNKLVTGTESQCPPVPRGLPAVKTGAVTTTATPPPVPQERAAIPLPSFELGRNDFKATGLEFETAFTSLYRGDFGKVSFEREKPEMTALMSTYIDAFWKDCDRYLPPNPAVVEEYVCDRVYVQSGACSHYDWYATPVRADPELYRAYRGLERLSTANAFGEVLSMLQNGLGGLADKVQVLRSMKSDVPELIKMNGCGSRALRRFQDNMRLYAENRQPIVISSTGGATVPGANPEPAPPPPAPLKDQNFTKMLDDLVRENSRSWAINRYQSGSMSGVKVSSRDQQGRPRRVQGTYVYEGFSGRTTGTVALEFSDGAPQCLYFWDFPTVCRTPDRSVSAAYQSGNYATRE